jgi:hypothetical protein
VLERVSGGYVADRPRRERVAIGRESMFALSILLECAVIVLLSLATGTAWHLAAYGETGPLMQYVGLGLLVAVLYESPLVVHSHYRTEHELAGRRSIVRLVNAWTYAFLCLAVVAFLTKTGSHISRGWLVLLFCVGLVGAIGFELAMRRFLDLAARRGLPIALRRVAVIGTAAEIDRFRNEHTSSRTDIEIASCSILPEDGLRADGSKEDLLGHVDGVIERARRHGITDVVILADLPQSAEAMRIAEAFLDLPVAVHLGRLSVVELFPQMRVAKLGNSRTLVLRAAPLSMLQVVAKRAFDIIASGLALLLLAPVLLVVAVLIKLDSRGPVFFQQRRRGFNQKEFRIWKFRTMTTLDDGDVIVQAGENDARVTRVDDPSVRPRAARYAIAMRERHGHERMLARYRELYRELIT